jgi:hypothetical protein
MNILLFFIISVLILKYFFDISYINNIYKWLKIFAVLILLFLFYKYYNNEELKNSIIYSISKVDKIPVERTFSDISNYLSTSNITPSNSNINKKNTIKRNVTNGQKKYVASIQKWRCGHCDKLLDASYEVDHIHALYKGGTNDLSNLVALCRNCHGMKTTKERLNLE